MDNEIRQSEITQIMSNAIGRVSGRTDLGGAVDVVDVEVRAETVEKQLGESGHELCGCDEYVHTGRPADIIYTSIIHINTNLLIRSA